VRRRIVFTDIGGTLPDHRCYDWQPAAATLEALGGGWDVERLM